MGKFLISGEKKLYGTIKAQSAKNALLPLICACVMLETEVVFTNCSKLGDIETLLKIISKLGGKYSFKGDSLSVDCTDLKKYEIPPYLASEIRASVFMLGPLLARFKCVIATKPGGCNIGNRPIDMHVDGIKKFGVKIEDGDVLKMSVTKLTGANVNLKYASVGVTENLLMLAVLSDGESVISNCAREPEIVCLADFLKLFGAKIKGAGTSTIVVEGVKKLKRRKIIFNPISDRIEVGTYILSVLGTGGEIEIENSSFIHNASLIKKIYNNACKMLLTNDRIYIKCSGAGKNVNFTRTAPYPAFPTDLQTPFCAYCSTLNGVSIVEEGVFENRFCQISELNKMGANILVNGSQAKITGVKKLVGCEVSALDLRGGASLIIAGLKAEGQTLINNASIIERGYKDIDVKLSKLGASVKKVD